MVHMSVFQMSVSAAILILAVVIIRAFAGNKLPRLTFVIIWIVLLLRLLIPLSVPVSIPYSYSAGAAVFSVNTFADEAMRVFTTYEHGMHFKPRIFRTGACDSNIIAADGVLGNLSAVALVRGTSENRHLFVTITAIWLGSAAASVLFFLGAHLRYRKEYKASLPVNCDKICEWLKEQKLIRSIQIRQSDIIKAPLTYGVLKPVILLPKTTDWQDEINLQYVLTHELIHIRRFDVLIKWLLVIALCIHWFNPLVWTMYILANRDIELACDEATVKAFGEKAKPSYALALIKLEESKNVFFPVFSNFAKSGIEKRINAIMKIKKTSVIAKFAAFIMVLIFVLTACGAMQQGPVEVTTGTIAVGLTSSFRIEPDGILWAWGGNDSGQLGDGTTQERYAHQRIMENVTAVSAGPLHTLAVTNDNILWAWGENNSGRLGDGTVTRRYSPVRIMEDVIYISAGGSHTMAIRADSSLWAWGANEYGQLGDGTLTERLSPVKIMEDVALVSAGAYHTLAIRSDGSLWAWGRNNRNQLGDGMTENRLTPVQIMENAASASAGNYHSAAILEDGSLWAWGFNMSGQIGDGTRMARPEPVKIMDGAAYVSAGAIHTALITNDGNSWVWGSPVGELEPRMVMDNVVSLSVGAIDSARHVGHMMMLRNDGSLWAWGNNRNSQLGIGRTRQGIINTPTRIVIGELPDNE